MLEHFKFLRRKARPAGMALYVAAAYGSQYYTDEVIILDLLTKLCSTIRLNEIICGFHFLLRIVVHINYYSSYDLLFKIC